MHFFRAERHKMQTSFYVCTTAPPVDNDSCISSSCVLSNICLSTFLSVRSVVDGVTAPPSSQSQVIDCQMFTGSSFSRLKICYLNLFNGCSDLKAVCHGYFSFGRLRWAFRLLLFV